MDDTEMIDRMNQHLLALTLNGGFGQDMVWKVTKAFEAMAENQLEVSASVPDCIPKGSEPPSKDAIRSYVLAIFVELGEFLQELDWKPWKNGKNIDREKVAGEFADILAFLGVLFILLEHLGISEVSLAEAYRQKSIVNVKRFLGQHDPAYRQVNEWQQPPLFEGD